MHEGVTVSVKELVLDVRSKVIPPIQGPSVLNSVTPINVETCCKEYLQDPKIYRICHVNTASRQFVKQSQNLVCLYP